MSRLRFRLLLATLSFLVAATRIYGICHAQIEKSETTSLDRVTISDVRVGFAGRYKVGCWTPVWITLEGSSQGSSLLVDLVATDGDGGPARFVDSGHEIAVPREGKVTVVRYAKFGRMRSSLQVELRGEIGVVAKRSFLAGEIPVARPSNNELFVTVGESLGVEEVLAQRRGAEAELAAAAFVSSAAQLPDRWWGYEGVDVLCWAGSQAKIVAELSAEQLIALDTWVRLGGRLLLSVGVQGETLLGPEGRFRNFNPGRFVEVVEQRRTADLERYASASQSILPAGQESAMPLKLTVLADLPFREEAAEGSGSARHPTVLRFPYGLGQIVLVTLDLDRPPLSDWSQRTKLVTRLLAASPAAREENIGERQLGQLTHLGFDDLGGQLRGALDQFAKVPLFRFSWVAGILVLYILLIGPADYFFLRHFTRRMELTWVTLPIVVLAFCGTAALLAQSWKGDARRLNQVDLVDIDMESGLARGTSWVHLYTPRTEEFDLMYEARPPFSSEPAATLFTWQGLPGKGLGGMDGSSSAALFSRPYSILSGVDDGGAAPARLEDFPVQVSSTKSMSARWWTKADLPRSSPDVGAKLAADADGRLHGVLVNPLKVELLDGVLFFETSAYKLKERLAPGERLALTPQSPVVHVERRLTQRRIVDTGETKVAWNPESFDIPRIMEIMMFHDAAGGRAYTGLASRQQPFVDLSGHLKAGRAVLLARAETPAARILQDGQEVAADQSRQFTFFRLVFPVGKRAPNS